MRFLAPVFASVAGAQVATWGQCGGTGYTGSTDCVSGTVCSSANPYYCRSFPETENRNAWANSPCRPMRTGRDVNYTGQVGDAHCEATPAWRADLLPRGVAAQLQAAYPPPPAAHPQPAPRPRARATSYPSATHTPRRASTSMAPIRPRPTPLETPICPAGQPAAATTGLDSW